MNWPQRLARLSGNAAAIVAAASAFVATGWAMSIEPAARTGSLYLAGSAWVIAIGVVAVVIQDP